MTFADALHHLLIAALLPVVFGLWIIVDWEVQRIRDIKRARRSAAQIKDRRCG